MWFDWVQIPENLEAKVKLFKTLEQHCSASTILATNTIELPIDSIQYVLLTIIPLTGMYL